MKGKISSAFDDSPHHLSVSGSIQNTLKRLLPDEWNLPVFKGVEWGNRYISLFVLSKHRMNGAKFFYEMISRWLMPGKRPKITSFFATDFELMDESLVLCEAVIDLQNPAEKDLVLHQLPVFESEVLLGLSSVYHANRILEIKGLAADEKTSLIQERIVALLQRRPQDFDHDIFVQMQHFLVMCSDEFKAVRECAHLCRIISVFYLLRKAGHRFVSVKLKRTSLHLPFGRKRVLGVFIALHLNREIFEEGHLLKVLEDQFPDFVPVQGSYFSQEFEGIKTLYLEVEKKDLGLGEVKRMEEGLSDAIRNGIEKLAHAVFMPRNEEEVMRNIITLSNQLKLAHDLPQVVISFDEQTAEEVLFTVIWLRVLKGGEAGLQELWRGSAFKFVPDRVKQVGTLRKKYGKEATVFRLKCEVGHFLRSDHSVDLFKARQAVVENLKEVFGEFRDYNGGMIAKQHEQYFALRNLLPGLDKSGEALLEKFFHSIYPIEMRSLFDPAQLKKLFVMLCDAVKKKEAEMKKVEGQYTYFLRASDDKIEVQAPSPEALRVSLVEAEVYYWGFIYPSLTFEAQTVKLVQHEKETKLSHSS